MIGRVTDLVNKAYGGLSRSLWLLAWSQLINRTGTMVVFFLSVYLKDELHYSLSRVGIAMALFGAGSLLGVFVGGKLVDRIGYYPVMLTSLLMGGVIFLLIAFVESFPLMCVSLFVLSAVGEAFRPANMAAISFYSTPETYTRAISLNRLAVNLGFSIGPALGGFLASINYEFIFWADGITCIGAAVIVWFFLENKHHSEVTGQLDNNNFKGMSPYTDKIYLFFLPVSMLYSMSFFQFFSTMPIYYKDVEHFNETQIGWLMALNGILVATIEMIMIYKIEKKWSPFNFIALGAGLLVFSYISLLFFGGYAWILVLTVIISFSEMFALPFMNTFMNSRSDPSRKGQYASLYVMSWSVAQIITPVIVTQIIHGLGYTALWLVMAAVAVMVWIGAKKLQAKVAAETV